MQPARADVVWNFTVPASAATAGERHVVMMSFPWCPPLPRGAPKSLMYVALPTTGNTSFGTAAVEADAGAAARAAAMRTRSPRAEVRCGVTGSGSALEGRDFSNLYRLRQTFGVPG